MLGVCYYPEHWPQSLWESDAKEMAELGLKYVRIGEFSWSRVEPSRGNYSFDWLDKAIEILAKQNLKIIMCTPTATPPKWLIDEYPDVLPVDIHTGVTRGFGSRRHYDFSSENYQREALRISEVLAKRYGTHSAICGWQTDNEIACHDTAHSGSEMAKESFQFWCEKRYKNIEQLNQAWGNVFWSMEYQSFQQIELPILAVTETSPAHQLAYRRFSSDQVIEFHDRMINVIKHYSKNQFITHNFIPMVDTQTDNFALADSLDFASYDNYPLGRSDMFFKNSVAADFKPYMRTGHPDFSSYSFDQIRGISHQNFWIMEQQPGPVNWAHHNPRPEKGMVRLWSWQAFAHGAECICFFRWRQAAFAQEQMHAGVKRNDNSKAAAWTEIEQMRDELAAINLCVDTKVNAKVAIVTGTLNQWVCEIERQGDSYNHQQVEFSYYSALRQLGLEVDFISQDSAIEQYELIIAPCLPMVSNTFVEKLKATKAQIVFGPRSGSKTEEFSLAPNLAPGLLQSLIPVKIISVETIRPDCSEILQFQGQTFESRCWREELKFDESDLDHSIFSIAKYHDGSTAVAQFKNISYIASLTCESFLIEFFDLLTNKVNLNTLRLPKDMRMVRRANLVYLFNYSPNHQSFPEPEIGKFILGSEKMKGYDVAIIDTIK
jgi:beta-galactosidase